MSAKDVLPPNATTFERALAHGLSEDLPVPIGESLDAATAPAAFLPFVAHAEGVVLWFDDWSEARKRHVAETWLQGYAKIVGTRLAADAFLALVDANVVHRLTYPAPFIVGETAVGTRLVDQPHHSAHYLIAVDLVEPVAAFTVGYTATGDGAISPPDDQPIERALAALIAAKSPTTEYRAHFDTRRPITSGDAPSTSAAVITGQYLDRLELSA